MLPCPYNDAFQDFPEIQNCDMKITHCMFGVFTHIFMLLITISKQLYINAVSKILCIVILLVN